MLNDGSTLVWMAALTVLTLTAVAVAAWLSDTVTTAKTDAADALQAAGEAVDAVNEVIDHLTGTEPPAEGRHAPP